MPASTAAPNPYERANRAAKAQRIADALWASAVRSTPDDELPATVDMIADASESWRVSLARACGEGRTPSEETWGQVGARLRSLLYLRQATAQAYRRATRA